MNILKHDICESLRRYDTAVIRIFFKGFLVSCQFNIDTACVDVEYEDGFVLSIYTPAVEDAVAHTMQQRSELDWLIYNDPLAYVGLIMSGKSEEYLKAVTR